MAMPGALQLSVEPGIYRIRGHSERFRNAETSGKLCLLRSNLSPISLRQYSWSSSLIKRIRLRAGSNSCRKHQFRCHCFFNTGPFLETNCVKNATLTLARSFNQMQASPPVIKLASAVGIVVFAMWGLPPLVRLSRNIILQKNDGNWKKSNVYKVTTTFIQPLLLWVGTIVICRTLDPMILPTEASQIVKQRLLHFVKSLSTVLAFAYCLSSVVQQAQKYFMEVNEFTDARNMGFQFAGKAIYTAVWVAAVSLFMELLGFSTQRWLTAGGLGTVMLTLAGREIFTNFLSSAMIHATRPFVLNEWIQTKIEGYEVSGTVERVGWWSPTIIRGEDREAVHIPNHKFTVNVVRNLSQKTHWRIKTHLAISHLDVSKINSIVADMRKVLSKNPQVEQQKLHRRVFLENINPENQALMILVSCFVKTSRFEEYLCVKEAILLDLLRVIRHHRARLATPIRTVQKVFTDAELDNVPFSDSMYNQGNVTSRPLLLIEPSYKINGEDKTKPQARPARPTGDEETKASAKLTTETKVDAKGADHKTKDMQTLDVKAESERLPEAEKKGDNKSTAKSSSDPHFSNNAKPTLKTDTKHTSSSTSSHDSSGRKSDNIPFSSQPKHEGRQPAAKSSLEENIVLGVALEGSKRTLPIEYAAADPQLNSEDAKELATMRSGNANSPPSAEKEKNDIKKSNSTGSPPVNDRSDLQE